MQGLNSVMRTLLPLFLEQERKKKSGTFPHSLRTCSARSCKKGVKEEGRGGGEQASQELKAKEKV